MLVQLVSSSRGEETRISLSDAACFDVDMGSALSASIEGSGNETNGSSRVEFDPSHVCDLLHASSYAVFRFVAPSTAFYRFVDPSLSNLGRVSIEVFYASCSNNGVRVACGLNRGLYTQAVAQLRKNQVVTIFVWGGKSLRVYPGDLCYDAVVERNDHEGQLTMTSSSENSRGILNDATNLTCQTSTSNNRWARFKLVAPETSRYQLVASGLRDLVMHVFSGECSNEGPKLGCGMANGANQETSILALDLKQGQSYIVFVGHRFHQVGPVSLRVTKQNSCFDLDLGSSLEGGSGLTVQPMEEDFPSDQLCVANSRYMRFRFSAPQAGVYTFRSSNAYGAIGLHKGVCRSNTDDEMLLLACSRGWNPAATALLEANQTVLVVSSGLYGEILEETLSIHREDSCFDVELKRWSRQRSGVNDHGVHQRKGIGHTNSWIRFKFLPEQTGIFTFQLIAPSSSFHPKLKLFRGACSNSGPLLARGDEEVEAKLKRDIPVIIFAGSRFAHVGNVTLTIIQQ